MRQREGCAERRRGPYWCSQESLAAGIVRSLEVLTRVISCSLGELSQAASQEESVPRGKSQDNF